MRLLFIGDVVGSLGRNTVSDYLPKLKKKYRPQVTIVNGENAASGRGITEKIYKKFLQDGADVITLGNHAWDNRGIFEFIEDAKRMVRPANFPTGVPGVGVVFVKVNQQELAVVNLQGRSFMVDLDDPFRKIEALLAQIQKRTPYIFVDFHAEHTEEKEALAFYLDGKVTSVAGTHTHVQTADERILPKGTCYITDLGITGVLDGVIGSREDKAIERVLTQLPIKSEVKEGVAHIQGIIVEADKESGKALSIKRFSR